MQKNSKQNSSIEQNMDAKQKDKNTENQTGYGDKKLEGPNRPQD